MQPARTEQGAAASALLVAAVFAGLATFLFIAVPFGAASDAKAQNRTAADAAALAGAEAAKADLLAVIGSEGIPEDWTDAGIGCELGLVEAQRYARANEAELVEYCFDVASGTAHATVEGQRTQGALSRSDAVAEVDLPDCEPVDVPTPTPAPTPTATPTGQPAPTETAAPAPPSPSPTTIDCDIIDLEAEVRFDDGPVPTVVVEPGSLQSLGEAMEVRLIE